MFRFQPIVFGGLRVKVSVIFVVQCFPVPDHPLTIFWSLIINNLVQRHLGVQGDLSSQVEEMGILY